jgi:hypothetical protein
MMVEIKLDGLMIHLRKDEKIFSKETKIKLPALRKMIKRNTIKLPILSMLEKKYGKTLIKKFLFEEQKQNH